MCSEPGPHEGYPPVYGETERIHNARFSICCGTYGYLPLWGNGRWTHDEDVVMLTLTLWLRVANCRPFVAFSPISRADRYENKALKLFCSSYRDMKEGVKDGRALCLGVQDPFGKHPRS
jgi:hypothetical protein